MKSRGDEMEKELNEAKSKLRTENLFNDVHLIELQQSKKKRISSVSKSSKDLYLYHFQRKLDISHIKTNDFKIKLDTLLGYRN